MRLTWAEATYAAYARHVLTASAAAASSAAEAFHHTHRVTSYSRPRGYFTCLSFLTSGERRNALQPDTTSRHSTDSLMSVSRLAKEVQRAQVTSLEFFHRTGLFLMSDYFSFSSSVILPKQISLLKIFFRELAPFFIRFASHRVNLLKTMMVITSSNLESKAYYRFFGRLITKV